MRPPKPPSPWVIVLTGLLGTAVAMVLIIGYVKRVDKHRAAAERENDRQICGIVVLLDDRNQSMPPAADPATAQFRREVHAYRVSLGC